MHLTVFHTSHPADVRPDPFIPLTEEEAKNKVTDFAKYQSTENKTIVAPSQDVLQEELLAIL